MCVWGGGGGGAQCLLAHGWSRDQMDWKGLTSSYLKRTHFARSATLFSKQLLASLSLSLSLSLLFPFSLICVCRCVQSEEEAEMLQGKVVNLRRQVDNAQAALHELGQLNQTLQVRGIKGNKFFVFLILFFFFFCPIHLFTTDTLQGDCGHTISST